MHFKSQILIYLILLLHGATLLLVVQAQQSLFDIEIPDDLELAEEDIEYISNLPQNNTYYSPTFLLKAYSYVHKSPYFQNYTKKALLELLVELETWEPPKRLVKNFPYYLAGYDIEDRPLWIAEVGKYDIRGEVERGDENIAIGIKYGLQAGLRVIKSIFDKDKPGREVRHAVFLGDCEGLDMYQLGSVKAIALGLQLAKDFKIVAQEVMGTCVAINVNFVAEIAINLVRPIAGHLMERVEIHGTNKAKWKAWLRRTFPENIIPTWYGGSKKFKPLQVYG